MAMVRVFLCTYRRPLLLQRALDSLLRQTMSDWVCELHNDDPCDLAPAELVKAIGDSRVTLITHAENWGATRTLSALFTEPRPEPYVSLLEDDNWWEPAFLERMTTVMAERPSLQLAWSDMRLWREEADGSWTDTRNTIWGGRAEGRLIDFDWPPAKAWRTAVHSHGAMIVRSSSSGRYLVPPELPVAVIEHARERSFDYPITLVNEALANFAITRETTRGSRGEWSYLQTLLTSTYFANAPQDTDWRSVWDDARESQPPVTNLLITAALRDRRCRYLLRGARVSDAMRWLRWVVRHPRLAKVALLGDAHATVEYFLDEKTRMQFSRTGKKRTASERPAASSGAGVGFVESK